MMDNKILLIEYICLLPTEIIFNILRYFTDDQLLKICLVNDKCLIICCDKYMSDNRHWTKMDRYVFFLKLVHQCCSLICNNYKLYLEKELKNDTDIILNYNRIFYTSNIKVNDSIIKTFNNTKMLRFNDNFNLSIDLRLFVRLNILYLGNKYNTPINFINIKSLRYLNIGYSFNKSINKLPDNVEIIILLNHNYDIIINKLPLSIKYIKISKNYSYLNELLYLFQDSNKVHSLVGKYYTVLYIK